MNNFPDMTEEQRQELIAECEADISCARTLMIAAINVNDGETKAKWESQLLRQQVALAALTAELFAYSYLYAAYETCDGFTGWSHKFSLEHPPEWMLETGKVKSLRKLYTAPPAPVLRFPDEKHYKESPHGESSLWAMGWNECLAEVKRLNGQPSPPEASNDQ